MTTTMTKLDGTTLDASDLIKPRETAEPTSEVAPDFSLTLPKAVFELHRIAAKPEDREFLQFIEIRQIGNQLAGMFVATATDGARAITITFEASPNDAFGQFPSSILLPAHLLKATKPKGKLSNGTVSAVGDAMRIQTGDLVGECATDANVTYPNVAQVIPPAGAKDGVACKVAGFNLSYLADVAAIVKACGSSQPAITWPSDDRDPLRADCELADCTMVYVQMPVRL